MGTEQEHQGVDSQACRQKTVDGSIGVLGAEEVSDAGAQALSDLDDAECMT